MLDGLAHGSPWLWNSSTTPLTSGRTSLPRLSTAWFTEAAAALTATVTNPARVEPRASRHIILHAPDIDELLVDWLSELVGWFDIEQFLTRSAAVTIREHAGEWKLEARVRGDIVEPSRHPINVVVKGVTYHDLRIEQTADGMWRTRVIFDV